MFTKVTVSMLCITVVLITALCMHVNGVLLAGGMALLAGLGGFVAGKKQKS